LGKEVTKLVENAKKTGANKKKTAAFVPDDRELYLKTQMAALEEDRKARSQSAERGRIKTIERVQDRLRRERKEAQERELQLQRERDLNQIRNEDRVNEFKEKTAQRVSERLQARHSPTSTAPPDYPAGTLCTSTGAEETRRRSRGPKEVATGSPGARGSREAADAKAADARTVDPSTCMDCSCDPSTD
jgi:uncharacterized protein with von Willebrand factor type A (vWA) domain